MASDQNPHRLDFLRDAWRLAKPYFVSDDRKWAWGLLAAVIALNLLLVGLNVRFNFWRNDFYNAVQNYDEPGFWKQLAIFTGLAVVFIATAVYSTYLQQMLQIRWRRWLTKQYLHDWLDSKAYYRLQLTGTATDNPDQRIQEDLNRFTDISLTLTLGLLNSIVTLFSFVTILWSLSGPITLFGITIPGYMVWFALLYAILGTAVTMAIGRPLIALNFMQQRYEADFRFSLVRLRENAEGVALYGGEEREHAIFLSRFDHVVDNFWTIMRRIKAIGWWTNFYAQFAIIFPYVVVAPRYFAKAIQLGGLMQTAEAFGQVQSSLSFIVNSYTAGTGANDTGIAAWRAVVQRLVGFDERVRAIAADAKGKQPIDVERDGDGVAVQQLDLALPDGTPLLRQVDLAVKPGEAMMITGPTGSGKSTLLRAMAGIWPYGRGAIRMTAGKLLFLPQKPYLPIGTLRQALIYPKATTDLPDSRLTDAMTAVGLEKFLPQLDEDDNWPQRLSLGEQQRLAIARILLIEPNLLFLDEATSALDEPSEAKFYEMLRKAAWHPTIVSVGHRSTLAAFHDEQRDIAAFRAAS
ncbi:MAG TPA: ABC transporter ATP-binding protein/permease [Stellaceae bacterium]|nr:ABC transporter ATP-binding protein/permease [Stellaceae bacterium]